MSSLLVSHSLGLLIVAYAWLGMTIVWIIGRITAKKIAHAMPTQALVLYFGIIFLCLYQLFHPLMFTNRPVIPRTPAVTTLGLLVFLIGLGVALWARLVLARNWSGAVAIKVDHELVERGPYRWLRHPMYTGLILMVAGTAIITGTPDALTSLVVFIVIHVWKMGLEETLLEAHFGQRYAEYRRRTRALIPLLY